MFKPILKNKTIRMIFITKSDDVISKNKINEGKVDAERGNIYRYIACFAWAHPTVGEDKVWTVIEPKFVGVVR